MYINLKILKHHKIRAIQGRFSVIERYRVGLQITCKMKNMNPKIAITMGDPAGVGPEIIVKALKDYHPSLNFRPLVVGNVGFLKEACRLISPYTVIKPYSNIDDIQFEQGCIAVYQIDSNAPLPLKYGNPNKHYGDFSFHVVKAGVQLAASGQVDALVTAPICKESWHLAGHHYDGHTELLAELTDSKKFRMMFVSEKLNVILVTIHLQLKKACDSITRQSLLETIEIGNQHMKRLGISNPKIGVCGLNPHAGENGLFGHEEHQIIAPAVMEARQSGISVEGPLPADTLFLKAMNGDYDLTVAQYHDQGLIPIKLVSFESSVNITIGLPIIRTSVDHGTAFDIAGQGKANHTNLLAAINCAIRLSTNQRN